MAQSELRVLHIEDDFADALLVQNAVCEAGDFGIAFEVVRTLKDAQKRLDNDEFDLILLDLRLPDSIHPSETWETTKRASGDTPILVLSGSINIDSTYLPSDTPSLDKNKSFRSKKGAPPVEVAGLIRETVAQSDVFTL